MPSPMRTITCPTCGHAPYDHDPEGRCMKCREPDAAITTCAVDEDEWDYPGGYSRSDLLFGGNW